MLQNKFYFIAFFAALMLIGVNQGIGGPKKPRTACSISGPSPVTEGNTYTYNLEGECSASSWSVSCGTIESSTSTCVKIDFNQTGCSSSTITANGTTATPKTVTID
jgi:hypothetical protein